MFCEEAESLVIHLASGVRNGAATLEYSLVFSDKLNMKFTDPLTSAIYIA